MKIEHIAINIEEEVEISDFYINILGMSELKNFSINKVLSEQIFKISLETPVFLLQKEDVIFEIFVSKTSSNHNYQHICISLNNREDLYNKALQKGYTCIRNERKESDMIFINDKSGNIFEIKES